MITLKALRPQFHLEIDGSATVVQQIGRGRFTTAYRPVTDLPHDLVYLFVREEHGDYSKRILEEAAKGEPPEVRDYLPVLEHLGAREVVNGYPRTSTGELAVFRTRFYLPLTAKHVRAWREFKALVAARDEAWREQINWQDRRWMQNGHAVMDRTIDLLDKRGEVPPALIEALRAIRDAAGNYGASYVFEFAKRNIGIRGAGGNLILLDPVFDIETVQRAASRCK